MSSIRCALEDFGIIFVDENGGEPGVKLRKEHSTMSDK
jgi:hypothetical protein